jgi:hypothetical protein
MKPGHAFAALAALLLLGNAQPPTTQSLTAPPTADEIGRFRTRPSIYNAAPQLPLAGWEADLRAALASGIDEAADALAPLHGMTSADMRRLVRLWLVVEIRKYDIQRDQAAKAVLRRELLALFAAIPRTPLVLQAMADGLEALDLCAEENFTTLMAGSTDRAADAWAIANVAQCGDNFLRAATAAPDRAMPALIRLAHYGSLGSGDALALYQWLTSPAALARIAEADRPALAAWLHANRAQGLFQAGLTDQAVALIEGLPEETRRRVLTREAGAFTAQVDGLPVTINVDQADESLKLYLASAYALGGRTREAEALLVSMRTLPLARQAFDCALRSGMRTNDRDCARIARDFAPESKLDMLLLDHLLHHPDDDPYPLAEAALSSMMGHGGSTALTDLRCRVFSEPQFADFCDSLRQTRIYVIQREGNWGDRQSPARRRAVLDALDLPGLAAARASIGVEVARIVAATPQQPDRGPRTRRTVIPAPGPFAELALPPAHRGPRPQPVQPPAGLGALPPGFVPVRFEREGARAVVISVSQTYDPTGEASQGGYWVHLSQDGGQHWNAPLYTGLAQNFPYVVPSASRMPLLDGDRLDLEVEVAELDTASITYPPVAMRSNRQASNLYLRIPLADLARDGNGDGITDIAARTLLLDRPRTESGTPFIVGSDAGASCRASAPDRVALIGLLQQLFSVGSGAIVEAIDRPDDAPLLATWRGAGGAADRPIFIQGDPRDYVCLRSDRLMIVYAASDIAALERFRPDFHAVTMPRIVYNRARDRGYVIWSAGWTGGTYRLRLVDGSWVFEAISSWIT